MAGKENQKYMYSKSYIFLFIANIMCAVLLVFLKGFEVQADNSVNQESAALVSTTKSVELEKPVSLERVIKYDTIKPSYCVKVSDGDIESLMKIVEAEAGGEDRKGKLLVANVVLNRVKNPKFPDNITDVVYQKERNVTQFSPVSNGTIYSVKISDETKEAVYSALKGEDVSNGALFFMARKYAEPDSAQWFDNNLTYLFSYGGHDFFKR